MRQILCTLMVLSAMVFIIACENKELTKQRAIGICEEYIKHHQQINFEDYVIPHEYSTKSFSINTFIAIDKIYKDYGWAPEKYKILEQQGIISLRPSSGWGIQKYEASITSGKGYFMQSRIWKSQTDGNVKQYIFKGYSVLCDEADVSSTAKDNKAEADVLFKISNVSPIQEVFNKPKEMLIRIKVNFKLFDSGWKIVEDEYARKLLQFSYVDNPMHWAGN